MLSESNDTDTSKLTPTLNQIEIDNIDNVFSEYRWTNDYQVSWESLKENADGNLVFGEDDLNTTKDPEFLSTSMIETKEDHQTTEILNDRNLLRCVLIVLDGSEAMFNMELRPSRFFCTIRVVIEFVQKFFQKNPISQLGLAMMYATGTKLLCPFMNGPGKLLQVLNELITTKSGSVITGASVSLLNALTFAMDRFQFISNSATKEVLFISANLTTVDPEDIYPYIHKLVENTVSVSAIQLAAELYILKYITQKTCGTFKVIIDESHFISCLNDHLRLQTTIFDNTRDKNNSSCGVLIKMGFPNLNQSNAVSSNTLNVLCNCHTCEMFDEHLPGFTSKLSYFCPICHSKYCDIPRKCDRCLLLLVAPPYLTRSYMLSHSADRTANIKIPLNSPDLCHRCYLCNLNLKSSDYSSQCFLSCPQCQLSMCDNCNLFLKDSLGFCPGCKF